MRKSELIAIDKETVEDIKDMKKQASAEDFMHNIELYNSLKIDIKSKYKKLYSLADRFTKWITEDDVVTCTTLFSRVQYISTKTSVPRDILGGMRVFCRRALFVGKGEIEPTDAKYISDLFSLVSYISVLGNVPFTPSLYNLLKDVKRIGEESRPISKKEKRIRIIVLDVDDEYIYGIETVGSDDVLKFKYRTETNSNFDCDKNLFTSGSRVNMLDCSTEENGDIVPTMIVYEPDYLVDCSSLAACVTDYSDSPYMYLYDKLKNEKSSSAIVLGNFANYFHDLWINSDFDNRPDYMKAMKDMFREVPIEIATNPDLMDKSMFSTFLTASKTQFNNIGKVVENVFPTFSINKDYAELEPSFECEEMGLQGRLDFFQNVGGNNVIIELKSGKAGFPESDNTKVNPSHKAQLTLYNFMVQRVLDIPFNTLKSFVFYSRYQPEQKGSLRFVKPSLYDVQKLMNIRNHIVSTMRSLALSRTTEDVLEIIKKMSPESMINNYDSCRYSTLINQYIEPQIRRVTDSVSNATEIERAYFCSFLSFLTLEQMYAKIGGMYTETAGGFASSWLATLDDKKESGRILYDLKIKSSDTMSDDPSVTFEIPDYGENYLANFRRGDIVIIYERNSPKDNLSKRRTQKGTIEKITAKEVVVLLRQKQHNQRCLNLSYKYALEPDCLESSFSPLYRGLTMFLTAPKERRDLILGLKLPQRNESIDIYTTIEDESVRDIVLRAKQSQGYFLLVGPPGTGKTSVTLKAMVMEEYTTPGNILLLSYTNRAVDEICESIERIDSNIDYIRIGSHQGCGEKYTKHLVSEVISDCDTRDKVVKRLTKCRIYVGTTASVSGRKDLFNIINFKIAIIDEASQILEPHLLPLLCAMGKNNSPAISKFIMIGDHRQLPAVVTQKEKESRTNNALLAKIGLTDRRNSLFERLYRLNQAAENNGSIGMLTKQGRMHVEVMDFPNVQFYGGKLECVPCPHQQVPLEYKVYDKNNEYERRAATRRMDFFPSKVRLDSPSNKQNEDEAEIVAEIVKACLSLRKKNNLTENEQTIGVITTYRNQIALIRKYLENIEGSDSISVDTVERYQGSQRDIIIYSFCINEMYQIEFVSNLVEIDGEIVDRKLNVALTRARKQCFVVGNRELLNENPIFRKLIESIENNNK